MKHRDFHYRHFLPEVILQCLRWYLRYPLSYRDLEEMIEDKPLASVSYGFDEQRQTLISYPNVEIGSKIYLKYQRKEFKAPLDKFFSRSLY